MNILIYIIWNFDPDLLSGSMPIRWYGLLFALGFLISQQVLFYVYKQETGKSLEEKKKAENMVENMTVYMIIATIVGARLGHVIFYEPEHYFTSFSGLLSILNIRAGGLASHGAGPSIFLIMLIYANFRFNFKEGKASKLFFIKADKGYSYLQIMDRIAIVVALTGALIRFGNFTNSEIIGKPTNSDNGVVLVREVTDYLGLDSTGAGWVESIDYQHNSEASNNEAGHVPIFIDIEFKKREYEESQLRSYLDNGVNTKLSRLGKHIDEPILHNLDYNLVQLSDGVYMARISTFAIPRHPAQLYESLSSFLLFLLLFYIWSRKKKNTKPGLLFGIFLTVLFTARFFHEFMKENQVPFEDAMALNMGQWLSIPMVIFGLLLLILPKPLKKDQGTGS